jgi:hypothetical protein
MPRGNTILYTIDKPRQAPAGHAGLVLPPLFLTMVFCFALVLVQQHQTNSRTAAKQAYDKSHPHTALSSSSLKQIDQLQPIAVSAPSSATANTANPVVSAPPQPSKASGSAIQSAVPNSQPARTTSSTATKTSASAGTSTNSVVYKVAQPVTQTLSNLLPR